MLYHHLLLFYTTIQGASPIWIRFFFFFFVFQNTLIPLDLSRDKTK